MLLAMLVDYFISEFLNCLKIFPKLTFLHMPRESPTLRCYRSLKKW